MHRGDILGSIIVSVTIVGDASKSAASIMASLQSKVSSGSLVIRAPDNSVLSVDTASFMILADPTTQAVPSGNYSDKSYHFDFLIPSHFVFLF